MTSVSTQPAPTTNADTASLAPVLAPIALNSGEGEALWFLGVLATIKSWFYVIEGELTFWVGGQVITAPAGSFVYGPRDIPHTFIVSSEQARFLLVTEPAGFENFVRALAEPAQQLVIPPPATEPPDMAPMMALAAEYGIKILGPPGIPT